MGTSKGLLPNTKGTPLNHTGGRSGLRIGAMGFSGGSTGTTVRGVSRSGKCDISGVPGGGSVSANSGARLVNGVCLFAESARTRFVPFERSSTSD